MLYYDRVSVLNRAVGKSKSLRAPDLFLRLDINLLEITQTCTYASCGSRNFEIGDATVLLNKSWNNIKAACAFDIIVEITLLIGEPLSQTMALF